ncbi:MAG: trypsin-like peptidase domain-containing protein [Patescibacteria group bacterium]|mgnify:CR=1 FL=1
MKNQTSRKILIAVAAFALIFFAFRILTPAPVHADVLDFLKGLIAPLFGGHTTNTSPAPSSIPRIEVNQPPISLYKPAIDYEKAVVAAVKKASQAVVSITVSKNVPIIENCPSNPFSDLPPEFRRFFGDDFPQFSVPCEKGSKLQEVGGGSGFIISSDGLILTNKHVVADSSASYTVFTNDGKKYDAKVLAKDPMQDLAVIKISAAGLTAVELGDSDEVELGQTAIAIGNSLGEFRNTVSVGVISGLSRSVTASGVGIGQETIEGVIQTDAAINPGNSGGPLLNLRGEVIGINTAVALGAQNIGFAIPINAAKRDINSVKKTGDIEVPFLGVRYLILTPDVAKKQKLPVDYGALVRGSDDGPAVTPGSPADVAGIVAEDIILELNGKKINKDYPLGAAISRFNVGESVAVKIRRGEKDLILNVVLAKRPKAEE